MLNPARSLQLSVNSSPELPRIEALESLYRQGGGNGVAFRQGEVTMIAGRSGSQKSGFALWLASQWNLPTLYHSADMSAYQASIRLACSRLGETTDEVEARWAQGGRDRELVINALRPLDITFSFGAISLWGIEQELNAYVELHNEYPKVICLDNLMDIENAQSDYHLQTEAMQFISELSRNTGASVIVMHHCSESVGENMMPGSPPPRHAIKNKLGEKPELTLTVGLDPHTKNFNIACVKQRMGPSDAAAQSFATLTAQPDVTRFHKHEPFTLVRGGS